MLSVLIHFNPHNPLRSVASPSSFYRQGQRRKEKISDFPKVTQVPSALPELQLGSVQDTPRPPNPSTILLGCLFAANLNSGRSLRKEDLTLTHQPLYLPNPRQEL